MSCYSQLYLERGAPQADSVRFRRRLAAFAERFRPQSTAEFNAAKKLKAKLGLQFQSDVRAVQEVFHSGELRDVLDAITVLHRDCPGWGVDWLNYVGEVFSEEKMAYRVDRQGVVHPLIDVEFQANRASTLEALADTRFGEARTDFDPAFYHLRNREGKAAIRSMFPAVEVAAKVLFPGVLARLMPNDLEKLLKPKIQVRYVGNKPAIDAALQLLGGFKQWIIASQPYRHGQEVQEPVEPPQDFLVAHLSTGAAYLRWMIELAG